MFDFQFPDTFLFFMIAAVSSAAISILFCWRPWRKIAKYGKVPATPDLNYEQDTKPEVTVVVHHFCHSDSLHQYLESLMSQDYPSYRVVIVCEASAAATSNLAEQYTGRYASRLYFTFIPPESHNLSRRKLAITIGIKAAKTRYVMLTSSNCRIPSESWLSEMMGPIISDHHKQVVLGYSHLDFNELHGIGKWFKQFDHLCTSAQWLGAALSGKPYRGDGTNLVFAKDLFFGQKGFSATMNLENGDDDLFINAITNADNTGVVISPKSQLTTIWREAANRIWNDQKERYDFTRRWLPKAPFFLAGFNSLLQWAVLISTIMSVIVTLPNPASLLFIIPVLCFFWIAQICIYRKVAHTLGAVRLWWSLPVFLLLRPIWNVAFRIRQSPHRLKNFTWQRRN